MSKKANKAAVATVVIPAAEPVGNYIPALNKFAPSFCSIAAATAPKAKATKAPTEKRVTKKSIVYSLLAAGKHTADELADIVGISVVAAKSLIGDLRRDMQPVKSSFENKIWYYTISE